MPEPERPTPAVDQRPTTRWGDRGQRRLDILDAARTRIVNDGYLSLNMRDLAAAAGVSPATLYSYFATKEELFATLYAEAIRDHTERVRSLCEGATDLDDLLARIIGAHIELYRIYGRHFTLFSALRADPDPRSGPFPRELMAELRDASYEYSRLVIRRVRDAADTGGRRLVRSEILPTFLWSSITGVADHLTSERRLLDRFESEKLVAFAAGRLAAAITEADASPH